MNKPLQELTLDAANDTIESILATAREMLEMDIAYVAQFTDGQQVFRHLDGDSRSFGVEPDQSMPLEGTSLRHLAPAVRSEHECWDGKGYPDGLSGYEIPVASRIVVVCDAYHAMTSDRPYRKALSAEEARMEIADKAGSQFCPESAEALLTAL